MGLTMAVKRVHRRLQGVLLLVLALFLQEGGVSHADSGPHPPCEGAPFPPYPDPDHSPTLRIWGWGDPGRDWVPPACTGWASTGFTTLVATVGRFRHASGADGLLRRIGAISETAGIRYWSTTRKRWQTLIVNARALTGPDGGLPREDFLPDEMCQGNVLYFQQEDNLLGKVTYRLKVRSASPDRLAFETENTGTVGSLFAPLFQPGEIQGVYFLERESQGVWRFYGLLRTSRSASPLTMGHDASYLNRAAAFYRHLVGIPTDMDPPASP